ncbi:MAG TPA: hypothetical protein VK858_15020 [Longimicrobiales bacterium]|nr:hypothetical protein [Longimicrobiales bacterium]
MKRPLRAARLPAFLAAPLLAAVLVVPDRAAAQSYGSIGAGVAFPTGELGDVTGTGFTVRGQAGLSLGLIDAHVQAGWSRFPGEEIELEDVALEVEDADIWHAGVGVRLGVGIIWLGGNVFYSWGDTDDAFGFAPEVGVELGPIELVADYLFGDTNWAALRAGVRF